LNLLLGGLVQLDGDGTKPLGQGWGWKVKCLPRAPMSIIWRNRRGRRRRAAPRRAVDAVGEDGRPVHRGQPTL